MTFEVTEVAAALAGVGVNLTPAELAIAEQRVADGVHDAVTAAEALLDERIALASRAFIDYPNVALLMGGETHVTLPDPEPVEEQVDEQPTDTAEDAEPVVDDPEAEATAEAEFEIGVEL